MQNAVDAPPGPAWTCGHPGRRGHGLPPGAMAEIYIVARRGGRKMVLLVALHAAGGWLLVGLEVLDRPRRAVLGEAGCADHVAPVFVPVWDHPVFGPPRPIVDPVW